ncbi:surface glycoprotein [Halorussus marinus]|uniref:surface glycoprotein n=1 Tax=Halorussus marinus TaxID=2505976 RepID=UPI0010928239|nr:surface glycoprotein [Halorussus marinus]
MTREQTRDKLRAVFLSALMVVSVFGGTVAFAGTAAANTESLSGGSAGNVPISEGTTTQTVSFDIAIDSGNTDTVTVDLSTATDKGATIKQVDNAATGNSDKVSLDPGVSQAGNTAEVSLADGGQTGATEISFDVTYDTSSVTSTGSVSYDITSGDTSKSTTANFNFIDNTQPTVSDVTVRDNAGDDTVTDGDTLYVSANATDNADAGVDTVTTDLSAFGFGESEELTTSNDKTYNGTFQIPSDGSGVSANDGNNDVSVTATDFSGNEKTKSDAVTYTPPVTIDSPTQSSQAILQSGDSLTVEVSAANKVNSVDITVENGSDQITKLDIESFSSVTIDDLTALSNGTYDIVAETNSTSGSLTGSAEEANALRIDDKKPTATAKGIKESSPVAPGTSVNATFTAGDAESSVASVKAALTLDGQEYATNTTTNVGVNSIILDTTGLSTDTYNLTVTVTDEAGNTATDVQKGALDVDGTAPKNVSLDSPTKTQYKRTGDSLTVDYSFDEPNMGAGSVEVVFADGDGNNATYTVLADSDGSETLTLNNASADSFSGQGFTNGTYNITVNVTDSLGNSANTTVTDVVEIDDIAPGQLDIEKPNSEVRTASDELLDVTYDYYENNTESVVVTLNGSSDDYAYTIDDSQYVDDNTRKSLSIDLDDYDSGSANLTDGAYAVNVTVTDSAGNENSTQTKEAYVVINDEGPDINDVSVDEVGNVVRPGDNVTVTYDYEDQVNTTVSFDLYQENANGDVHVADLGSASDVEPADNIDEKLEIPEVDGSGYYVALSSDSELGEAASNETGTFHVNQYLPKITSVDADAGTNTVVVEFNESVSPVGDDGTFTTDDFAYQDDNDAGASSIDAVTGSYMDEGKTHVTLELNDAVDASALGTDLVNARQGAIEDAGGANVGTEAVALSDSTGPSVTLDSAADVNNGNVDPYSGLSITTSETVDVTVSVVGNADINDSQSKVGPGENLDLSTELNLSTVSDTDNLGIKVEVEDLSAQGHTDSVIATVEKDTESPYVTSAKTNAGTDEIVVSFNEPVSSAEFNGENVSISDHGDGDASTTYTIHTTEVVQPADLNNESVQINAVSGTDDLSNGVNSSVSVNLTDGDAPKMLGPAMTTNGSNEITVQFSEQVFNGSGGNLTTANFTYKNESDQNNEIVGVEYDEENLMATLTLEENVTAEALSENDYIWSNATDSVGKEIENSVVFEVGFNVYSEDVSADGQNVTVSFDADEEVDSLAIRLSSEDFVVEGENLDVTLDKDHFEETENDDGTYTYEATYEVPRDGDYDVSAEDITAVGGESAWGYFGSTAVDANDPMPVDAEIASYDGDTTHIDVQFNEPVSIHEEPDEIDASVEGVDTQNVLAVHPTAPNQLRVTVDGAVQTGDAPNVTFTSGVHERFGDFDDTTGHTEVATLESQLSAGANFVSVPAASGELSASEVVTQLGGEENVDSIMTYDGGEWQTYNPAKPDDKQDFDAMQGGQGYIVTLNESAEFEVNVNNVVGGSDYDDGGTPQATQLEEGWNLVGQWQEGQQAANTNEALASVSDGVSGSTAVYGQVGNGYQYITVSNFNPGEAYWVFATEDTWYTESQSFDRPRLIN